MLHGREVSCWRECVCQTLITNSWCKANLPSPSLHPNSEYLSLSLPQARILSSVSGSDALANKYNIVRFYGATINDKCKEYNLVLGEYCSSMCIDICTSMSANC